MRRSVGPVTFVIDSLAGREADSGNAICSVRLPRPEVSAKTVRAELALCVFALDLFTFLLQISIELQITHFADAVEALLRFRGLARCVVGLQCAPALLAKAGVFCLG